MIDFSKKSGETAILQALQRINESLKIKIIKNLGFKDGAMFLGKWN